MRGDCLELSLEDFHVICEKSFIRFVVLGSLSLTIL